MNSKDHANCHLIEDLILTNTFLVKGSVMGKTQRLSKLLEHDQAPFLSLHNATKIDLISGEQAQFPQLFLSLQQLVLAHEYVDFFQDEFYGAATKRDLVMVQAVISGPTSITLTGYAARRELELSFAAKRFLVLEKPIIELNPLSPDVDENIFNQLPYVILNRERISCFYGVSPQKNTPESAGQ